MNSQTPGYIILPPGTAALVPAYRVIAPGIRLVGRADSVNMAELMAALDRALVERGDEIGSPTRG